MARTPEDPTERSSSQAHESRERLVYVMPDDASLQNGTDEIDLTELARILWRGKWIVIGVTMLVAAWSIVYALGLTHWYRSEVLLATAEARTTNQSIVSQLGGLAGLAGISVGGGGNVEPLAVLRSRDFTRAFIEDQNLLPILFADGWNAEAGRWTDEDPEQWPDIRDAVLYFGDSIRRIEEEISTGLVTVAVEWKDPELAAQWASLLVTRLNDTMRMRALTEAETNVEYLQKELSSTSVVALQQSIGRLLEGEMQKLMLARGSEEFAFRVIDQAEVPTGPSRPSRRLIVMAATAGGGVLSVFLVFALHFVRSRLFNVADPRQETGAG